jgi:thymidylate synthase
MSEGFPLLTTKKMPFKTIVTELLWFLAGRTDLKWLLDNDNTIWVGDSYRVYCNAYPDVEKTFEYEGSTIETRRMTKDEFIEQIKTDDEFAKKWGDLGPIYGKQWRSWYTRELMFRSDVVGEPQSLPEFFEVKVPIDQIANLINDLKTNPDSRRLMVNAWNVGELDQCVLPPCHYGFQVYTRELSLDERWRIRYNYYPKDKQFPWDRMALPPHDFLDKFNIPRRAISLMWNQRSVDFGLGAPFNIASYGLLLEIIAKEVNMVPDELIGNLGDVHLYLDHIEPIKEQLTREPHPLPKLNINTEFWQTESGECGVGPLKTNLQGFEVSDFILENYQSHPSIKAPLSN